MNETLFIVGIVTTSAVGAFFLAPLVAYCAGWWAKEIAKSQEKARREK